MKKQGVYVVGPNDHLLNSMWSQSPDYYVTSTLSAADIICFQGGADIHPKLYNEALLPRTSYNSSRDEEDLEIWNAVSKDKPKVGICRGGQFLNVMSEGELWQHVDGHMGSHTMTNLLDLPKPTIFSMGSEIEVTSDHHQMMVPNLDYAEVIGISNKSKTFNGASTRPHPEYDTEVVFYNHTQSLCFQPHPEYNYKMFTRTYFFKLMEFFFK